MHTMAFACLKSRLPEVANLLFVGAGTGFEIAKYGKAKSNWQILGVDPSSKMLAIAQDRINQSKLSQRVQLVQGYTQELPVAPLDDCVLSGAEFVLWFVYCRSSVCLVSRKACSFSCLRQVRVWREGKGYNRVH